MNNSQPVTTDVFVKRLTSLCLRSGLASFPKDDLDQQILLKSAVLMMGQADTYNEREINEKLDAWITRVCPIKNFDRVTLRRWLVDTGYLSRSKDGACYQVSQSGSRPGFFAEDVDRIDVPDAIRLAQEEMARKKKEYLERAAKK